MPLSRRGALRLEAFLPYRLSVTANRVSAAVARAYEGEQGMRVTHWRVMAALAEHDEATQQALCAKTQMDKMTVSRACADLVKKKWVQRGAHDDGRAWSLSLSAAGRAVYERVVPRVLEVEKVVFGGLSAAERKQLVALLQRVDAQTAE